MSATGIHSSPSQAAAECLRWREQLFQQAVLTSVCSETDSKSKRSFRTKTMEFWSRFASRAGLNTCPMQHPHRNIAEPSSAHNAHTQPLDNSVAAQKFRNNCGGTYVECFRKAWARSSSLQAMNKNKNRTKKEVEQKQEEGKKITPRPQKCSNSCRPAGRQAVGSAILSSESKHPTHTAPQVPVKSSRQPPA